MLDKLILTWLCCAVPVAGPSAETGWPTYHGGGNLAGVTDTALPDQPGEVWRFNAGGAVYNTPVSDGDRIYFSAKKGMVIAVDLKGSKVWKKTFMRQNDAGEETPYRFEAPLAVFGETVVAGTTRGMLFALDAQNGETQWTNDVGGPVIGSPNLAADGNLIVIDQSEGALHCLELKTGKRLWKTDGVERCDGSATVGGGRIVFGSCAAAMHVYSSVDGKHLKDVEMEGDAQIAGGAVLLGNSAFAGTREGELVHVDVESGNIIWTNIDGEDQAFSTPAVTDLKVVYGNDDGMVYALDRKDGKQLWKFDTGGMPTSPVIAKDKVVVTADGVLFLLNLEDGSKLWSKEVSDEITSPAIIGGMIVVGADDGTVTAFGMKK
ncbi:MAG: PQQ-binding-like beta-propeller repeat protein [Kiritimatiellales bacterium]|nr:PQQ-binding-like beta-propeller repeat protein [Kiritimatiellales bacterium]